MLIVAAGLWAYSRSNEQAPPAVEQAPARGDREPAVLTAPKGPSAQNGVPRPGDSRPNLDAVETDDVDSSASAPSNSGKPASNKGAATGDAAKVSVTIDRVVDGDTFMLRDGTRVRMLGINAPESVKPESEIEPWGEDASRRLKELIIGQPVRLEYDVEREDKFGRTLAWVWVGDVLVNEQLVREGLARAVFRFPYSDVKKDLMRSAQDDAKRTKRGVWSGKNPAGYVPGRMVPKYEPSAN